MIGQIVTNKEGIPVDGSGKSLTQSSYNPHEEIKMLFARVQKDYQSAWMLQNRPFREFDGYSLLDRTRIDQETFGAYVGADYVPQQKKWKWRGRKNTARNMVIGILAHVIAGMLFPYCKAYNEDDKEDVLSAKVMQLLVEDHLKRANYELKFLFMMTSALVAPAVYVEVEMVNALQKIKIKKTNGTYEVKEAVDTLLSGLNLNIRAIDELLLGDFYTFDLQRQPFIIKVRRITYDEAKSIYQGKYFIDGKDQFDYVRAGNTRVVQSANSQQILYDIDWTEADSDFVQEITAYYRSEDLEVVFVGGVYMGEFDNNNPKEIYNQNPFKHRRMSLIGKEWVSIPIYPFAKSGFEPLDPAGRFAFYKSACFKQFWDDASLNRAYQLAQDGMSLDVIKPVFISGVSKFDSSVMVPGAVAGLPPGASVTPYQMGPNISAALDILRQNNDDLSLSTQSPQQSGVAKPGITATASIKAEQNAKIILSVFGVMIADLVKQIGTLVVDDIIMHTTIGEIDATIPDSMKLNYAKFIMKGKEDGKDITNHIEFTDTLPEEKTKRDELEWKMFYDNGGLSATQMKYKVNAYKFARTQFHLYMDADMIVSRSMGTDQLRKERAFNLLMSPQVMPFINPEAVVDKFVLEEYSDGNPDAFKRKPEDNAMLDNIMNTGASRSTPAENKLLMPIQ